MSHISTHVLNNAIGEPAVGLSIAVYFQREEKWDLIATGTTNQDGRLPDLYEPEGGIQAGIYRIRFSTGDYFSSLGVKPFYPWAEVVFTAAEDQSYHIPLLLSNFGYSTYRGS